MTTEETKRVDLDALSHDVHAMRKELLALRRDLSATLRMLASLTQHPASGHGGQGTLPPHCPTCGSPLVRHTALAGDLMICVACGWSQFLDRKDGPCEATMPVAAPTTGPAPFDPWVT